MVTTAVIKSAKQPRKAFIFFTKEHRPTIRKATGLGAGGRDKRTELDAKVAQAWKHLPDGLRQRYREMAKEDRLRFKREIAEGLPAAAGRKKAVRKQGPKRALCSYMVFANARRQRLMDDATAAGAPITLAQSAKRLGQQWKQLPEEERAPFKRIAEEDKQRYAAEERQAQAEAQAAAVGKKKPRRDPAAPKPALNSYLLFFRANKDRALAAASALTSAPRLSSALAAEWRALAADDRAPFTAAAAADRERYAAELRAFRKG